MYSMGRCSQSGQRLMGLGGVSGIIGQAVLGVIIHIVLCWCRIAMELYEAVSRRMGIPEVVIRGFMGYMEQSQIFVVTFLGMLDPIQRTISTPQVPQLGVRHVRTGGRVVV